VTDLLFDCVAILDSLTGPPTILQLPDYDPLLAIDAEVALTRRPTVSVAGGSTFYLYGCLGPGPLGGIIGGLFDLLSIVLPSPPGTPMTLDNCAARCDFLEFNVFGMIDGQ
jgi:hypothetical protein